MKHSNKMFLKHFIQRKKNFINVPNLIIINVFKIDVQTSHLMIIQLNYTLNINPYNYRNPDKLMATIKAIY